MRTNQGSFAFSRRNILLGGALIAAAGSALATASCGNDSANGSAGQSVGNGSAGNVTQGANADGGFQLDLSFPALVDDDTFDDSLITNATATFFGFGGQGTVLVKQEP